MTSGFRAKATGGQISKKATRIGKSPRIGRAGKRREHRCWAHGGAPNTELSKLTPANFALGKSISPTCDGEASHFTADRLFLPGPLLPSCFQEAENRPEKMDSRSQPRRPPRVKLGNPLTFPGIALQPGSCLPPWFQPPSSEPAPVARPVTLPDTWALCPICGPLWAGATGGS